MKWPVLMFLFLGHLPICCTATTMKSEIFDLNQWKTHPNLTRDLTCVCVKNDELISCSDCDSNNIGPGILKLADLPSMHNLMITNLLFPTNIIPAYWFQVNIEVRKLTIVDNFINAIEPNAFNTAPFFNLRTLVLKMPLEILRNDTFSGISLHNLNLHNMNLHTVESNSICNAGELKYLVIENSILSIATIETIIACLPDDVQNIIFRNLQTVGRISQALFSKFKKVRMLSLQRNGITHIEQNSFDQFAETLEILSLVGNLLRTLSVDVLPPQYFITSTNQTVRKNILIVSNPWHCSCQLDYLKRLLLKSPSAFVMLPACETPAYLKGRRITDVELCNKDRCPFRYDVSSSVVLRLQQLNTRLNYDLRLILNSSLMSSHNLIWFEKTPGRGMAEYIQSMKCISSKANELNLKDLIGNLDSNKMYTVCLLEKAETTVNPMNCASYRTYDARQNKENIWLIQSKKITVLVAFIVSCSLVYVFGVAIVIILGRILVKSKENKCSIEKPCMSVRSNYYTSDNTLGNLKDQAFPSIPRPNRPSISSANLEVFTVSDETYDVISNYYVEIDLPEI